MEDIEIMARVERRRTWSVEEKAALVAEVAAEGGKVRLVARRSVGHRLAIQNPASYATPCRMAAASMSMPALMSGT